MREAPAGYLRTGTGPARRLGNRFGTGQWSEAALGYRSVNLSEDQILRLEQRLEVVALFAALATIPLTFAWARGLEGGWLLVGDWAVWCIFALEYLIMMAVVPDRLAYTRRSWFNIVIIVLTLPVLPELLALLRLARLARLARVLRLVRLLGVQARGVVALRAVLGQRGLIYVSCLTVVLILAGGAAIAIIEPDSVPGGYWTGVWWGFVTAATVGYGDVAPVTGWGRAVAVVLMIAGIGLVGTVAASVAAYLVGKEESEELEDLHRCLERIEQKLDEIGQRLP